MSLLHRLGRSIRSGLHCGPAHVVPERHVDAYATHIPVLVTLACLRPIHTVVEFGSGLNSTIAFLDRRVFPDLQLLTSYENETEWRETILRETHDDRLNLIEVDGRMADAVQKEVVKNCQLVLVDDSRSAAERAATIKSVIRHLADDTMLVVHDFEVPEYQAASQRLAQRFIFDAFVPMTGVLGGSLPNRSLRIANRRIRRYRDQFPVADAIRWHHELAGRLKTNWI